MKNRATTLFAALGLLLASIFGYAKAAEDINPFQSPRPPEVTPPELNQAPTDLDSFEFNGIMKFGGKTRISVYDTKGQKNYWLTTGEAGEQGLTLQRYEESNDTIVIARNGVVKTLSLKQVEIVPLRIASVPANSPATPSGSAAAPAAQPAVAETDEQVRERMQRVAEEIRRRRAERRKLLEERRAETSR